MEILVKLRKDVLIGKRQDDLGLQVRIFTDRTIYEVPTPCIFLLEFRKDPRRLLDERFNPGKAIPNGRDKIIHVTHPRRFRIQTAFFLDRLIHTDRRPLLIARPGCRSRLNNRRQFSTPRIAPKSVRGCYRLKFVKKRVRDERVLCLIWYFGSILSSLLSDETEYLIIGRKIGQAFK